MNASSLIAKIQGAAKKYGPLDDRTLYKRTLTEAGGDTLIDRGVTQTVVDTVFAAQPLVSRVGEAAAVISSTTGVPVSPQDYKIFFTPDLMTEVDLMNPAFTLVMKDAAGHAEVLQYSTHTKAVLGGQLVGLNAVYQSKAR